MAFPLIFFTVIVFIICDFPRSQSTDFPLDNCFTTEMNVLFLYFDSKRMFELRHQQVLSEQFIEDLLGHDSIERASRVMFADVIDIFSTTSSHVNFSSWGFHMFNESMLYGFDEHVTRKQHILKIEEIIELKVTFVERLFSEMAGVRENVIRIGVLFLDASGLSKEESKNVPHIVQRRFTHIKVFVVVMNVPNAVQSIQMNDTLFVDYLFNENSKHVLTLALCNQCMKEWFQFENNDATNAISCYKLMISDNPTDWHQSYEKCAEESAELSATETTSELNFLQEKLFLYFTEFGYSRSNTPQSSGFLSAKIFIGLQRDSRSHHRRFHWVISKENQERPLVINNWMSGHPDGSRSSRCVVWEFVWYDHCNETGSSQSHHCNDTGSSSKEKSFLDGWVDIQCESQISSFTLCEITYPVKINDKNFLAIKPAIKENFNHALNKGDFLTFRDNIVSITANIASQDFQIFLKQSGIEFPVFDCGEGEDNPRYISYVYVCDYTDHCGNRRDETFCNFNQQITYNFCESPTYCKGVICSDGYCLPLQFVNDGEIDCFLYWNDLEKEVHDESQTIIYSNNRNKTCAFICNVNECINVLQLNDGHIDCLGKEGSLDETIGKLTAANTCYDSLSQSVWAPRCVYFESMYRSVLGCRDKSHLNNCTDFECPEGYFKCPNTYCIPQHYVLDGKSDCPTGEDENSYMISPCSGNFACWNSQICLHPDLVCDGHPDCVYKDDEVDCDVSCPEGFRCISGTAKVLNNNVSTTLKNDNNFLKLTTSSYIDFSGADLSISNPILFTFLFKALIIVLSNCKLIDSILYQFLLLSKVREIDVSYNQIHSLDGKSIDNFPLKNVRYLNLSFNTELIVFKYLQMSFLETLDLSHTGLTDIDGSFTGLPNLKHLNLSFTFVTEIHKNMFNSKLILQTLDLRGLTMSNFSKDMFKGLTVQQVLYTDNFELCCPQIRGTNIPYYACHAPDNPISSCFDLIGINAQRFLLWSIAFFAVLGNITVIGYRIIWDRSVIKTSYGLFVTNLGISDFIMGVYLFIIAGADYYYRDIYVLYDKIWRESLTCKVAGFLATLSNETSIFFIFLVTLDRFLKMKFPFGQIKFNNLSKFVALILAWVAGLFLAVFPVVLNIQIYSSNAMCFGLSFTKRLKGWEFSYGVFIVFNFCMCLVNVLGQRAIFRAIIENRISDRTSRTSSRQVENVTVAKQLSLIAVTNFLCWFPVGIVSLLCFSNFEIRPEAYAWITVIVLPINSAANPLLYTIPALMARWEKFKNVKASAQHNRS